MTSVPEQWIRTERRELFCVDYHGISVLDEPIAGRRYFLDPTSPEVVDLVAATSRHILESYPALEGIQLDFIRYYHYHSRFTVLAQELGHTLSLLAEGSPVQLVVGDKRVTFFLEQKDMLYHDPPLGKELHFHRQFSYCFCSRCIEEFCRRQGAVLPAELQSTQEKAEWILGHLGEAWVHFRAQVLEDLLAEVRRAVKGVGADKELSITVWYSSPYGSELVGRAADLDSAVWDFGQDWWRWAEVGLVDFVCPMNYWLTTESFQMVIAKQRSRLKGDLPLFSGILRSPEHPLSGEELTAYLEAARRAGAAGLCFFHYGTWRDLDWKVGKAR
ncbi:MAG TPA: hypothetical protein PLZ65_07685 [Limnochordia bacterium]|nr:hypothetical protein [Limnochordia bacterium]